MVLSADVLKKSLAKLGYKWFEDRPNLIGIRSTTLVPDVFNDNFVAVWKQPAILTANMSVLDKQKALNKWLYVGENGVALKEDGVSGKNTNFAEAEYNKSVGQLRMKAWSCTTNPGVYYLQHPENKYGTAVYKPGQYVDAYTLGYHKQKSDHPALIQTGNVSVYRDSDLDNLAEETGTVQTGLFGCNIHRSNASGTTAKIGTWSAGCQVFQIKSDHDQMLQIARNYEASGIKKFTYTLLREKELGS